MYLQLIVVYCFTFALSHLFLPTTPATIFRLPPSLADSKAMVYSNDCCVCFFFSPFTMIDNVSHTSYPKLPSHLLLLASYLQLYYCWLPPKKFPMKFCFPILRALAPFVSQKYHAPQLHNQCNRQGQLIVIYSSIVPSSRT